MKPIYRCSSLPRIFGCNGSLTLTPLVQQREGDEGYEGVMIHWMIADRLIREYGAIPPEGGLPEPEVPEGYKLPAFSEWLVGWGVRHIQDTIPSDWSIQVEVALEYEFDTFILTGHADILAISPCHKKAKVKDWKTGIKFVEPAESNEQGFGYLCLTKLEWDQLTEVEFELCQPRADEESGVPRTTSVTLADNLLERAASTLDSRMQEAYANRKELNTGLVQCGYCIGCSCPAIRALENNMKMTLTDEMIESIKRTPDDAVLGDFVIDAKVLSGPIKDANEMMIERLKANGSVRAGCGTLITLKQSDGAIKVTNPKGAWEAVKSLVPDDKLPEVLKYSKERMVDVIAETRGINKGGAAPVTAERVYDAVFMPNAEQGKKNTMVFQ